MGFIDRLPHQLVAAFRATLEEVTAADLLVHVIDAAADDRERHVSRFIVGWAVSAVNDRHLTMRALEMALKRRCPEIGLLQLFSPFPARCSFHS